MTHRIVIVGGGAGGLELATRLGKTLGKRGTASVMLVDANLTHIWKPLLHEVAAGSLNSSEDELNYVAQAKWNHFEFQLGRMSGLDRAAKKIQLAATYDEAGVELVPAREVAYDSLVIAVGSTTNDFGTQARRSTACSSTPANRPSASISNCSTTTCVPMPGKPMTCSKSAWPSSAPAPRVLSWPQNCTTPPMNWRPTVWTGSNRKTCTSP